MNKNMFEFFNDEEFNIEEYDIIEPNELEKMKMKKEFRKNINNKKKNNFKRFGTIAAAALIGFGVFNTDLGQNVYAKAESKLSEMSYSIGNSLSINKSLDKYASVVNTSVDDKGVEIKLSEVIIDRDELIVSTIVSFNENIDGYNLDPKIYVNGKLSNPSSSTGSYKPSDVSENSYLEVAHHEVSNISQDDNLDIKIVIDKINTYKGEKESKIKGNWEFAFNVDGKELRKDTISYALNQKVNIGEQILKLKEITINPVNQNIYADIDKNESKDSYLIDLVGKDDMGNKVVFYNSNSTKDSVTFRTQDGSKEVLNKDTKFIELTPQYTKLPEESGRIDTSNPIIGETFIINLK